MHNKTCNPVQFTMLLLPILFLWAISHTVLAARCKKDIPHGRFLSCSYRPLDYCFIKCDAGYTAISFIATCNVGGKWDTDMSNICQRKRCGPLMIPNGVPSFRCADGTEYGTTCSYTCLDGFSSSGSIIECGSDGYEMEWTSASELCTNDDQCSGHIPHGYLSTNCTRNPDATCSFSCDKYYYKNKYVGVIQCLDAGQWNVIVDSLCVDGRCPAKIPNGYIAPGCERSYLSMCRHVCNNNYESTVGRFSLLMCKSYGQWDKDLDTLCTEKPATTVAAISCGTWIHNGHVDYTCETKVGDRCTFYCDGGYWKSKVGELRCGKYGDWLTEGGSTEMCIAYSNEYDDPEDDSSSVNTKILVPIIISLGIVVLVIIIICCCKRRNRGSNDTVDDDFTGDVIHHPAPVPMTPLLSDTAVDGEHDQHPPPTQSNSYILVHPPPSAPYLTDYPDSPAAPPPAYDEASNYPVASPPSYKEALENEMEKC